MNGSRRRVSCESGRDYCNNQCRYSRYRKQPAANGILTCGLRAGVVDGELHSSISTKRAVMTCPKPSTEVDLIVAGTHWTVAAAGAGTL